MENTFNAQSSGPTQENNTISSKKAWIQPLVTEIPKFTILGGVEVGKAEGPTLDGTG